MSFDFIVRIAQLDPADLAHAAVATPVTKPSNPLWFGGAASQWAEHDPSATSPDERSAVTEERRAKRFRAKYHTNDRELQRTIRDRAVLVLFAALHEAGAIFESSPQNHPVAEAARGENAARGPNGEVAGYKFSSNDGWHVTRDESAFLAERLSAALDRGIKFETNGFTYDVRTSASDKDDRSTFDWLKELIGFFAVAARHHGFEVW
ncbi:MAG: hypothetical protein JWO36_3147 [Myxococcales bacterium]|nr:hypothetical protein [Myxococcales bacterium]